MEDYFPFLPNRGIFFLDTCAFLLNYRDPNHLGGTFRGLHTIDGLKEETSRLRLLQKKLENMDNWLTIKEVIEEYKGIDRSLMGAQDRVRYMPLASAFGGLIDQRKSMLKLLNQSHVNASDNLTKKLSKKIEDLLPHVDRVFSCLEKKPHKNDTDKKLISTALVFAEGEEVGIFSQDYPLLTTFAYCAVNLYRPINQTYILDEGEKKAIMSQSYLRDKKKFLRGIHK